MNREPAISLLYEFLGLEPRGSVLGKELAARLVRDSELPLETVADVLSFLKERELRPDLPLSSPLAEQIMVQSDVSRESPVLPMAFGLVLHLEVLDEAPSLSAVSRLPWSELVEWAQGQEGLERLYGAAHDVLALHVAPYREQREPSFEESALLQDLEAVLLEIRFVIGSGLGRS